MLLVEDEFLEGEERKSGSRFLGLLSQTTKNPGETPLACHQSGDYFLAWCFWAGILDDKQHGDIGNEHVDTADCNLVRMRLLF